MPTCPFCAERIKPQAAVCRYCGRDLPPARKSNLSSVRPGGRGTSDGALYGLAALALLVTVVAALLGIAWLSEKGRASDAESAALAANARASADSTDLASLRVVLDDVRADLAKARADLADAHAELRGQGDLEAQVRTLRKRGDLQAECIDDFLFAYNSSTFVTDLERNFQAAVNGSACSALGYSVTLGE